MASISVADLTYSMPSLTSAATIVTGYLDALERDVPDDITAFVADDFENEHLSSIASSCSGIEEYRRRLPDFLATFASRTYTVSDMVEQIGQTHTDVVVRYRFAAIYEGTPIDIPGVMWFKVVDGQITKRTDVWDSGTFLAQVGH